MLAGTVVLILVIGGSIAYWVIQQLNEASLVEDFATVGLDQLISTADILPDGSVKYDPDLLKRIEENNGWLQILDEQGRVLDAFIPLPMCRITINLESLYPIGKEKSPFLRAISAYPGTARDQFHPAVRREQPGRNHAGSSI